MKLLFGTAGIPKSTIPRNTANGIENIRKLGLDAMELEFVHSVNISKEAAPTIKATAQKNKVTLTCHGQYYINLHGDKAQDSIKRLLNAARIANACGGWSVCFHAGFYLGASPDIVYKNIEKQIKSAVATLKDEGNNIWIRPEVSGKPSAFGSLDEVIKLSQNIDGVLPCIDFAHMHARTNGKYNSYDEFASILSDVEKHLGKSALQNMHIHVSGIEYGEKGERNHLTLEDSDFNYKELIKAWQDFKVRGVVISESPNIEEDAKLMQKTYG